VACGVACVLLIALWVRSYSISDGFYHANNAGQSSIGMTTGILSITHAQPQFRDPRKPSNTDGWVYISAEPTQFGRSTLLYFQIVNANLKCDSFEN
jgi:hypothetical protein